jgi:hypothetical protein
LTHNHLINFFILKKLKNIYFSKKKKKNLEPPLGWLGNPQEAKRVAETTPQGGLGVVSATPLGPWGGRATPWAGEASKGRPSGFLNETGADPTILDLDSVMKS